MKKEQFIRPALMTLSAVLLCRGQAQVSTATNFPFVGDYVGCDVSIGFPLQIRHNGNRPIEFYTSGNYRMVLNHNLPGQFINTYGPLDLSGCLGVGVFPGPILGFTYPSAKVHVENSSTLTLGYRDMIGDGFLATQGERLAYFGLLGSSGNAGILWARYTGSTGLIPPGAFQFIYTGDNQTAGTVAASATGLELGRFQPDDLLNEGYFGLGDWTSAGAGFEPTERLDLLNGRARLRQLPDDPAATSDYWVMVVDKTAAPSPERGVVKWVDPASLPSGCDWVVDPTGSSTYDICTAYTGSPCTWDDSHNVGIGLLSPTAKLEVVKSILSNPIVDIGFNVRMGTNATLTVGGFADVGSGTSFNLGFVARAYNAARNYALAGEALTPLANGMVVGAYGYADGNYNTMPGNIRGVWGIGLNPTSGGTGYGGWFDGYAYCSGGVWTPSDANLKTDVLELPSGLDQLDGVHPKSFRYQAADFPTLGLDTALHFGFIAQELEEVFPQLVHEATQPARLDSLGNEVAPAVTFKVMNTEGLLPWAFQSLKELKAIVVEQQGQIAVLQTQVAACCAFPVDDSKLHKPDVGGNELRDQRLNVVPNPVEDKATITFSLAAEGEVLLTITTINGRQLAVLTDGHLSAGEQTIEWNTHGLASGTYQVVLLVDGVQVSKKAIKIAR